MIYCSVPLKDADTLLLGVMYRSPNSSETNNNGLMDFLAHVRNFGATHLLTTGDFNFPLIDWSIWSSPERDTIGNSFLEILDDLLLFQHVYIVLLESAWVKLHQFWIWC